jgi:RNA polymerase sigma-70 factor (ECF subfamily)
MKWNTRDSGAAHEPEAPGDLVVPDADEPPCTAPAPPEFVQVYTEHFDFACRSLRLLGVGGDAIEDAAQDVFGVVYRRLPEFAGNSSLKTWIFAIVQRVAANHRRTRRRKWRALQPLVDEPAAPTGTPEAHAEALQAAARIQAFCDGLDESRRALLVLALIEDVPARELAPMFGVPLFTVYSRIRSLRTALERFLQTGEVSR